MTAKSVWIGHQIWVSAPGGWGFSPETLAVCSPHLLAYGAMACFLLFAFLDATARHVARATAWHVEELVFSHPDCCRENELLAATLLSMFYLLSAATTQQYHVS
jgi:hypothetical protein